MMGDSAFYERVLEKFYRQQEWRQLEQKLLEEAYKEAFYVAHDLKGVTATLGLLPLNNTVCAVVEDLRSFSYTAEEEKRLKEDVFRFFEQVGQFSLLMEKCDKES